MITFVFIKDFRWKNLINLIVMWDLEFSIVCAKSFVNENY